MSLNKVTLDNNQLASVMAALAERLPLKYRTLYVQCANVFDVYGTSARVEVARDEIILRYDLCSHAHSIVSLGAYAYAVAMALDDSRIVRLPLRQYDVERCAKQVSEVVSAPILDLSDGVVAVMHQLYVGEMVQAVNLRPQVARKPVDVDAGAKAHAAVRAAFGFELATGAGSSKRWSA